MSLGTDFIREDALATLNTSLMELVSFTKSETSLSPTTQFAVSRDFAFARARDALNDLLPASSELRQLAASLRSRPAVEALAGVWTDRDDAELQFLRMVSTQEEQRSKKEQERRHLDLARVPSAPVMPEKLEERIQQSVDRQLVHVSLKHPVIRLAFAAITVCFGFAFYGVLKFEKIEFDITKRIIERRTALELELEKQRAATESLVSSLKASTEIASAGQANVEAKITEARNRVAQLETDADRVAANFKRDIERKYSTKFDDTLDKIYQDIQKQSKQITGKIVSWSEEARNTIAAAATKRADELSREVRPEFGEKLKYLESEVIKEIERTTAVSKDIAALAGKQELLTKALAAMSAPAAEMSDRLAGYLDEAVYTIYGGAIFIVLLSLLNIFLFVSRRKR